MPELTELVTANEAAALAMVDVRDVHRVFDERLFPDALLGDGDRRRMVTAAVPLLAFYFRNRQLNADARRTAIDLITARGRVGPIRRLWAYRMRPRPLALGDGITADLSSFFRETERRIRELSVARAMVHTDPEIMGGSEPVIRGTRVPVYDVAAAVEAETPISEILTSYPGLTEEQVHLSALFAKAERPRGRPRRRLIDRLPPGGRLVASGRVAHPKVTLPGRPATTEA
jgi:uncharacterized protein (DUF433 family)